MKTTKFVLLLPLLLLAGIGSAWAHGGRVGVYFGPYWGPPAPWYYYPPPPHYYRQEIIVVPPPEPTVYIEQAPAVEKADTPPVSSQAYWYYCTQSKAYYPAVKECPGGWQKVLPQSGK